MDLEKACSVILEEVRGSLAVVKEDQLASLCDLIASARAVFVTGEGRSGLVGRCFAMRLMHLGLSLHVVGGTTTPRLGKGDLLVAISGTGETELTCAAARLAAAAGGTVAAVTAAEGSALAATADLVVLAPAAGPSQQYGGSLFEQSVLIALDAVALALQQRLGVGPEAMDARHANLE